MQQELDKMRKLLLLQLVLMKRSIHKLAFIKLVALCLHSKRDLEKSQKENNEPNEKFNFAEVVFQHQVLVVNVVN